MPKDVRVLLVDAQGRILMQHRSADAPAHPNKWTAPGGGVEQGETFEEAAHRELLEETGLTVAQKLALFRIEIGPSSHKPNVWVQRYAFYASTTATQADVVLGEGQAMLFLPVSEIKTKDLSPSSVALFAAFFDSPQYQQLLLTNSNQIASLPNE